MVYFGKLLDLVHFAVPIYRIMMFTPHNTGNSLCFVLLVKLLVRVDKLLSMKIVRFDLIRVFKISFYMGNITFSLSLMI